MKAFLALLICCLKLASVFGDLYLHSPRGSNNRLTENTATRSNNNRLYNTQNNARGGYNVGDSTTSKSQSERQQYRMNYFQSGSSGNSELTVEWTNQHGCGGDENNSPHKLNCNLVLQFMCQDDVEDAAPRDSITFRNGRETDSQEYSKPNNNDDSETTAEKRRNGNVRLGRGLHESWEWYDSCYRRERNKGLFTADQTLNSNNLGVSSAIFTRQSPNENRYGYECPEERDYYPYFHPTPWVDIAVLAHNESSCSYYTENSFNGRVYGECVEQFSTTRRKHWSTINNAKDCAEKDGAQWVEYHNYLELAPTFTTRTACLQANSRQNRVKYIWGKPYDVKKIVNHENIEDVCFVAPPTLDCKAAEWSRANHLGNGRDLTPLNYTWKLPYFPSGNKKRCVFRMRYNISTDDYDPFNTDASKNQIKVDNVITQRSPIEQNPLVDIGANGQLLQLAINTDQTGRTFQDRSHVFFLSPRPQEIPQNAHLLNLNVRGKRGNIVQVYPAVEYDFIPNRMTISEDDFVHIQWTGSNTHNNNAPGGDGATGSAGEGEAGTDRHNLVEILQPGDNFPRPYDNSTLFQTLKSLGNNFATAAKLRDHHRFLPMASHTDATNKRMELCCTDMEVVWSSLGVHGNTPEQRKRNIAIQLASSGYFRCEWRRACRGESIESKDEIQNQLNNAPASFHGIVIRIKKGIYYYMCTRNNSFTNRSQKGMITVQ